MILREFLVQFVVLALVLLLLSILKRLLGKKVNLSVRSVDASPVLMLYFIHTLTLNSCSFSLVPDLIIIWVSFGFVLLIVRALEHRLSVRKFYLTWWRIGDVYLLISWLVIGVIVILKN